MKLIEETKAAITLGDMLGGPRNGPSDGLNSIKAFVDQVIDFAMNLAGIIAFGMILYGAFMYVTAYGDESKAENGKKTMLWAIIGIVVIATAKLVTGIVKNELKQN